MATLMLEGTEDTRPIRRDAGDASLQTTQISTQVSIRQLKAVTQATHPSAKRRRNRSADED